MFKLLCLLAVVAFVAGMPNGHQTASFGTLKPMEPDPIKLIAKREAPQPIAGNTNENEDISAVEGQDDMDKSETFGYGYRRYYYRYPRYHYYPSYRYYPYYSSYYW
ncbi:uncharacterized protein LOC128268468 [Anopheles cruzii]|uniref:uncharacterized protein LOC128268468 n=1 Tax=Anopheles cruzii TaxID=68878 RepID=UPI0022EC902C|nr:uncharacterized protein LOC128268468 [Anopheles cruzii]